MSYPPCEWCGETATTRVERGKGTRIFIYACLDDKPKAEAMARDAQNATPNKTKDWFKPAPEVRT